MEELVTLAKEFEKRNNISIYVTIYSDGSASVNEFWDEEQLFNGKTTRGLFRFLRTVRYKLDPVSGRCISPVQRIKL